MCLFLWQVILSSSRPGFQKQWVSSVPLQPCWKVPFLTIASFRMNNWTWHVEIQSTQPTAAYNSYNRWSSARTFHPVKLTILSPQGQCQGHFYGLTQCFFLAESLVFCWINLHLVWLLRLCGLPCLMGTGSSLQSELALSPSFWKLLATFVSVF